MADCTEILADLVRRPSVNPMGRALSGHEYLEGRVTEYLLNRLKRVGITAVRQHVLRDARTWWLCYQPPDQARQCFFGMSIRTPYLSMV